MNTPLDEIPLSTIGARLRNAREAAQITQAAAASAIAAARTTIIAIEQGQRRIRIAELQKLAQCYRTSVNALLRNEAVHVDLAPRFRRLAESTEADAVNAVQLLSDLAKAEVELENLLGVQRVRNYPPERPIHRGDVRVQAEQDAFEFRQWLGRGISPISNIVTVLEMELGVRIYIRRIDARISGLFAYDETLGPCMLLNASHPRERRAQTAAHETGHLISSRQAPEILHLDDRASSRDERYAQAFGRAFLTPALAVTRKCQEVTAGADRLTRRHVIVLAHFFGVSRESMVRRLEELELTKHGTWDWFESNGGITDEQARQVLGDLSAPDEDKADADRPTTMRLSLLAAEAYRRELLSEGQLARLLHLDRVELRELLHSHEVEGSYSDEAPSLLE